MDALDTIAALSREFGGPEYVLGGGGNTSCKDETTLWIKPSGTKVADMTRESVGETDAASVTWSGPFVGFRGDARSALTPDHIVYAKAWYLVDEPTRDAVAEFREKRGYPPRVVVLPEAVFGIGPNGDTARLAREFAQDATLVKQLAAAFGGLKVLGRRWSDFIENWEVEAYRRRLAREGKA